LEKTKQITFLPSVHIFPFKLRVKSRDPGNFSAGFPIWILIQMFCKLILYPLIFYLFQLNLHSFLDRLIPEWDQRGLQGAQSEVNIYCYTCCVRFMFSCHTYGSTYILGYMTWTGLLRILLYHLSSFYEWLTVRVTLTIYIIVW